MLSFSMTTKLMFSAWVCKNINMKYSFIYFIEGIVLFTLLPISVLFVIHIDNGLMGKIIMCYIKKLFIYEENVHCSIIPVFHDGAKGMSERSKLTLCIFIILNNNTIIIVRISDTNVPECKYIKSR